MLYRKTSKKYVRGKERRGRGKETERRGNETKGIRKRKRERNRAGKAWKKRMLQKHSNVRTFLSNAKKIYCPN